MHGASCEFDEKRDNKLTVRSFLILILKPQASPYHTQRKTNHSKSTQQHTYEKASFKENTLREK